MIQVRELIIWHGMNPDSFCNAALDLFSLLTQLIDYSFSTLTKFISASSFIQEFDKERSLIDEGMIVSITRIPCMKNCSLTSLLGGLQNNATTAHEGDYLITTDRSEDVAQKHDEFSNQSLEKEKLSTLGQTSFELQDDDVSAGLEALRQANDLTKSVQTRRGGLTRSNGRLVPKGPSQLCSRCGNSGHVFRYCPTIGDPNYDPAEYNRIANIPKLLRNTVDSIDGIDMTNKTAIKNSDGTYDIVLASQSGLKTLELYRYGTYAML